MTKLKEQEDTSVEQLNNGRKVIDFLRFGFIAFIISMVLVVFSVIIIFTKGFNLGSDFTGGTKIEVQLSQPINIDDIRTTLNNIGYHDVVLQNSDTLADVIIRLPIKSHQEQADKSSETNLATHNNNEAGSKIIDAMYQHVDANLTVKSVEYVGPTVGAELAQDGILAICVALVCILIYIAFRFEWRFGTGAVVALAHDVVITAGYLSLFDIEMNLTIIAALLSIIGYSLNDTIVVFDRIRENFRKIRRASPYDVINISLTQTLTRTLMTSGTTLMVVAILFIFGGDMLRGFSETLGIGILLGTISSIYVAAYMSFKLGVKKEYFMPPKVEVEGADQPSILP